MNKKILAAAFAESPELGQKELREHMSSLLIARRVATPQGTLGVLRSANELMTAIGASPYAVAQVLGDIVSSTPPLQIIADEVWPDGAPR